MFRVDRIVAFRYPCREIAVAGWCCFDDLTPIDDLWMACDGTRIPCLTGLARPDIARAFNSSDLECAGFSCRFPEPHRGTAVYLIARRNGLEHNLGEVPIDLGVAEHPESAPHDYATWLRQHESGLHWQRSDVAPRLSGFSTLPVLSVILPTYNTPLHYLHRCIASVRTQLYPYWELCITDDASRDSRVRQYLVEQSAHESRIRLSFLEQNGGISKASNQSIATATGDFIVLLDHDDELHGSALLEVARLLNVHTDADVIYSDEDKIDQLGVRTWPAFKPDFDEDLLRGFNYLGHLVAIRTTLARQVGGFRTFADGAQDWDLLLRVASATQRKRIWHIPKPLYHWRMHDDSTAASLAAKPYAVRAWRGVLEDHLRSESCSVREGLFLGSMKIARALPTTTPVSILYRACDGLHQRRALVRSKIPSGAKFFEVLLSSIHPADEPGANALMTVEDLQSDVTIVVSRGIDSVNHHFLEELAVQAVRHDCGVVGGTILRADGAVLTAGLACLSDGTYINPFEGLALHAPGYMGQARVVRSVPAIASHAFAFRTSRLLELNGLASISEDSLDEVCASLVRSAHSAGLKVLHTPYAVATLRSPQKAYYPPQSDPPPRDLMVNPNLEGFSSAATLQKVGIQ